MASVSITVTGTLKYPDGAAAGSAAVKAVRFQDGATAASVNGADTASTTTNATTGVFSLTLLSNSAGGGTFHKVTLPDGRFFRLPTPTVASTIPLGTLTVYQKPCPTNEQDITSLVVSRTPVGRTMPTTQVTIATTGNTDAYVIAPVTGALAGADFSGTDALAANDTNYVTFSVTNITNASAAMLAASDANTTKATGGTAISANTNRALTLHGTVANLAVSKGDRIRVRYAATGTLANTVTFSTTNLVFTAA